MVRVTCHDYGHDCDFMITAEIDDAVEEYNKHSEEEHGIEYAVSYTHLTLPTIYSV